MGNSKKYNVKLNNLEKIEQLLQETYDLACQQHNSIQNEINKIMNTTVVNNLDIDGKEKYGKIMKEYFTLQQKSIVIKMDVAKLMTEVAKNHGDIKSSIENISKGPTTLNLASLRKLANEVKTSADSTTEEYNVKN